MQTSRSGTTPLRVAARVRTLMKQLVALLKNMHSYDADSEALEKSVDLMYSSLRAFLDEHETLQLRVRRKEIAFGDQIVYVPIGRSDALLHPLYRDGVKKLTFNKDVTRDELVAFAQTLVEAQHIDPYEADLVTALWERDLANINHEAEDVYIESAERGSIDALAADIEAKADPARSPGGSSSVAFLMNELGLDSNRKVSLEAELGCLTEEDIELFRSEAMHERDSWLLEKSGTICLEILEGAKEQEAFARTTRFLGEICDRLVSQREFMSVCFILSDLRAITQRPGAPGYAAEAVADLVRKCGDGEKLSGIESYYEDLSDAKMEELFCYLAQMDPVAVGPLCRMLTDARTRRVRYMLARVISIVAKDSIPRLEPFLKDSRWYVVRNTAMILGMICSRDAIPYLQKVAVHPEDRVRREVARALGRTKNPEGLPALKSLINDANKITRLAAAAAAGEIGGDRALELLEDAILDGAFEAKAVDEKRRFMEIYGSFGEGSVGFLSELIEGKHGDLPETTRACAVYGLASAGCRAAWDAVERVLRASDGAVRCAAVEAVSMLEENAHVPEGD